MKPDHEMGHDAYADQRALIRRREGTFIFDVGTNVEKRVERYCALFEDGEVHAFEPDSKTFDRLRDRFAGDRRVRPVQAAVLHPGRGPRDRHLHPPRPASPGPRPLRPGALLRPRTLPHGRL